MAEKGQRLTLTEMRLRRAMSATELARAVGVATSTITNIEKGTAKPRMSTIRSISQALGCEPQDILWPGNPFSRLNLDGGAE